MGSSSTPPGTKKDVSGAQGAKVAWDSWLYAPGMPPVTPQFDDSLAKEAIDVAERWIKGAAVPAGDEAWGSFSTTQRIILLDRVLDDGTTPSMVQAMDSAYRLLESGNSELHFRFLMLALAAGEDGADAAFFAIVKEKAVGMATSQGRMKFTRPLFKALFQVDKSLAQQTFTANAASYHPICRKMVAKDLEL